MKSIASFYKNQTSLNSKKTFTGVLKKLRAVNVFCFTDIGLIEHLEDSLSFTNFTWSFLEYFLEYIVPFIAISC